MGRVTHRPWPSPAYQRSNEKILSRACYRGWWRSSTLQQETGATLDGAW